jgi:hypothetical protein
VYNKFEQAFVDKVDALFENDRARAIANLSSEHYEYLVLEAPYIKFRYSAIDNELVALLKVLTCDALVTYAQFHTSKPPGFPDLPLSFYACKDMKDKRDKRAQLTGLFGTSQLLARWDKGHPSFDAFNCGLMADERTPKDLREDFELRQIFPPKRLQGLTEGSYWCTFKTLGAWCDLVARIDASVKRQFDNPNYQATMAESLFRQVSAPVLREMFS